VDVNKAIAMQGLNAEEDERGMEWGKGLVQAQDKSKQQEDAKLIAAQVTHT